MASKVVRIESHDTTHQIEVELHERLLVGTLMMSLTMRIEVVETCLPKTVIDTAKGKQKKATSMYEKEMDVVALSIFGLKEEDMEGCE